MRASEVARKMEMLAKRLEKDAELIEELLGDEPLMLPGYKLTGADVAELLRKLSNRAMLSAKAIRRFGDADYPEAIYDAVRT